MKKRSFALSVLLVASGYVAVVGCGDDPEPASTGNADAATADRSVLDTSVADVTNDRGAELTGQSCKAPTDCYGGLDAQSLKGEAKCLDRVTDGYCTHLCTTDEDCCAVPGECRTGLKQVCAPFESTGEKYCFVSCEPGDIQTAADAGIDGGTDEQEFCARTASSEFGCRSTGGGNDNRKVCLPSGGAGDGGGDGGGKDGGKNKDAASDADADAN
jgi:hypothetical protein